MLSVRTRRVVCVLAILGSAVAACGQFDSPTPAAPVSETPTVSEVKRGTEVKFEICGSAGSWERPSEEEQASVWESGRYAGADDKVLKYPWTQDFFVSYGSASVEQDLIDLTGLWTLPEGARAGCIEAEQQQALIDWEEVGLWILLHRVEEVRRTDAAYTVVVEPVGEGAQFVRMPRPDQLPLPFTFVTEGGEVVDEIVEEEYRYWPGRDGRGDDTDTPPLRRPRPRRLKCRQHRWRRRLSRSSLPAGISSAWRTSRGRWRS